MTPPPTVKLENVGRSFGNNIAVKGMDLVISGGEIVSLVGHSGCGKSTLLRMIAGVESLSCGNLFLNGSVVDGGGRFVEPELRSVGFVFQDYALFPHLSVRDNILFGLKKRQSREASDTALDVMGRIGIRHLQDRFPHTLSGGEQQRVALARALAPQPGLILLDEPFSNLDQGLREQVRDDTLSLLRAAGTTVIMVTHDPQEALSCGDRVVLMRSGEIVQEGTSRDLYGQPENAYAADFFGTFNKIPGIWQHGSFETAIGRFEPPLVSRREGAQSLYVRPHAINISLDVGDHVGRIESRVFLGASEKVSLRVEGLEKPLTAVLTGSLPSETVMVRFSIAPDMLLTF